MDHFTNDIVKFRQIVNETSSGKVLLERNIKLNDGDFERIQTLVKKDPKYYIKAAKEATNDIGDKALPSFMSKVFQNRGDAKAWAKEHGYTRIDPDDLMRKQMETLNAVKSAYKTRRDEHNVDDLASPKKQEPKGVAPVDIPKVKSEELPEPKQTTSQPDSKEETFKSAFIKARESGKSEFEFNGKRFTSKLKDETSEAWAARMKKARGEQLSDADQQALKNPKPSDKPADNKDDMAKKVAAVGAAQKAAADKEDQTKKDAAATAAGVDGAAGATPGTKQIDVKSAPTYRPKQFNQTAYEKIQSFKDHPKAKAALEKLLAFVNQDDSKKTGDEIASAFTKNESRLPSALKKILKEAESGEKYTIDDVIMMLADDGGPTFEGSKLRDLWKDAVEGNPLMTKAQKDKKNEEDKKKYRADVDAALKDKTKRPIFNKMLKIVQKDPSLIGEVADMNALAEIMSDPAHQHHKKAREIYGKIKQEDVGLDDYDSDEGREEKKNQIAAKLIDAARQEAMWAEKRGKIEDKTLKGLGEVYDACIEILKNGTIDKLANEGKKRRSPEMQRIAAASSATIEAIVNGTDVEQAIKAALEKFPNKALVNDPSSFKNTGLLGGK